MTKLIVIGAGVGGLCAAIEAARQGCDVTLIDKSFSVGGKIRTLRAGSATIDAGPTVFTMKPVFDSLFARCGRSLDQMVETEKLSILARHFWPDGSMFDLHADPMRTIDAVAGFAGSADAIAFAQFRQETEQLYRLLSDKFIFAERKGVAGMIAALGPSGLLELTKLGPFATLWQALGRRFNDPRLRQLFARYATYSGGSPFLSPATLMLIADVEMQGVWAVKGGMVRLAEALAALAREQGAIIRLGTAAQRIDCKDNRVEGVQLESGEYLAADRIIFNGDVAALADGLLGDAVRGAGIAMQPEQRSLSAMTWCVHADAMGERIAHHNVFFDWDYQSEFDDIFRKSRMPHKPTLYLCAQDRGNQNIIAKQERIFMLINAPACGDQGGIAAGEIKHAEAAIAAHLARQGLSLSYEDDALVRAGPEDFAHHFPATGGALYGQAPHGWIRSVTRGDARCKIEGLYRCGGSVHPGAGVPMAALSGLKAASALMADCASTSVSRRTVISGGISTRSARTEPMA